jgi:putative ABC transport system permease protein
MLKNYLKVAIRNLLRNKTYSLINILGLTTGLTAAILLIIFIFHELSYDRFHENRDRIHRVKVSITMPNGNHLNAPLTKGNMAPRIEAQLPEVKYACRIEQNWDDVSIKYDNKFYKTKSNIEVDTSFFEIFTFPLVQGNQKNVFKDPHNIILVESLSKKIFGKENAIGKTIEIYNDKYTISGIVADPPANSHMQFSSIISNKKYKDLEQHFNYKGISIQTYFLLNKNCKIETSINKLNQAINKDFKENFGKNTNIEAKFKTQALTDIHLGEVMIYDFTPTGKMSTIWILLALSFFILLIAVINFTNLFIAKSEQRIKEVGVRKSIGALSSDLRMQFWGESAIITFASLFLSLGIAELLLPHFSIITNRVLDFSIIITPTFWLIIIPVVAITIFLSGTYPALYLARFTPAMILRGTNSNGKNKHLLKSFLVLVQFAIAIFLITNLLILNRQMDYIQSKDLGFNLNENIIIPTSRKISKNYQNIKEQLKKIPTIKSISASSRHPGVEGNLDNLKIEGELENKDYLVYHNKVQCDYIKTLGLKIVKGRDFNKNMASDSAAIILNQTAVKKLGFENPIGKRVDVYGRKLTIIGITADYNFLDLHKKVEPMMLTRFATWCNSINVCMNLENSKKTIQQIKSILLQYDPNYQKDIYFINDFIAKNYKEEKDTFKIVFAASLVAIILSILGLIALTSFIILRRTKEIGLRKVLGSSETKIILDLGIPIIKFIAIANLIAWPLSYFMMDKWLNNFAYRINMQWYHFLIASLIGLTIAIFAISFKVIKAARENPVVALKTE